MLCKLIIWCQSLDRALLRSCYVPRRETNECNVPEIGRSRRLCHSILQLKERLGYHDSTSNSGKQFGNTRGNSVLCNVVQVRNLVSEFRSGFPWKLLRIPARKKMHVMYQKTGRPELLCHGVLQSEERLGYHETEHLTTGNNFFSFSGHR